jgi:acyl-CoA reductase-like NAD-dependent aldehyde dehydrogenase
VTVRQVPVGVVGVLMPWNNPVALPCGAISSALAFGNGVVFKPAPEGSATALGLMDSLVAAGIPSGLVGLVMGDGDTGTAMADEPLVDALAVTGSIATGRALAARCGASAKPLRAELGGNNAAVVLADADLDEVVGPLVRAAYSYSGQRCTGIRRFVVEAPVFDEFLERAAEVVDSLTLGDPADPSVDLGPLISVRHRDRARGVVASAVAAGATLVRGGNVPDGLAHGAWFAPTLLVVDDPRADVVLEETFGPVVVVQPAKDIDDAIALANGVAQGLVMTVCTRDPDARRRIEAAADVGIVQLGAGAVPIHADAPFGGRKASGIGPPEHGEWDAQFFSVPQVVYADA